VLGRARGDIRRITTMLDSLLDIAASEANRGNAEGLAPFDLSAVASDMAELYRSSIEEAGLNLVTSIAPSVTMCGEAMQIGRLLANLLDNAVKYVPAGGTISLTVQEGPRVVVSDDGPGIAAELRADVFDRFRRGRDAGQTSGHGLGLALARAIALRHDLVLTLGESSVGCRFELAREDDR
jgi:signal transduction histidine kinase